MTKKIFLFIPTLSQGGCERAVSELSLRLPERLKLGIILFERKISYPFRGTLIDLHAPFSSNMLIHAFRFFARLFKFRQVLAKERPDAVVSFINTANIVNILMNQKRAILRIDVVLSETIKGIKGALLFFFVRFYFPKARWIVTSSRGVAQDLVSHFSVPKEKIVVIYNSIDVEEVRKKAQEPLDKKFEELFSHPVFINVGRLTKWQKGHPYLLSAFALVKKEVPDAKLVILGEGPMQAALEEQARTLGIAEDVHLLGWQQNPFPFLMRSRIFVLSSLLEGFSYVVLEALACGLPVVSTDCKSGPREILAPGTDYTVQTKNLEIAQYGALVPAANERMLAEAMVRVYKDKNLQELFRKRSLDRAKDFNSSAILGEWTSLFEHDTITP